MGVKPIAWKPASAPVWAVFSFCPGALPGIRGDAVAVFIPVGAVELQVGEYRKVIRTEGRLPMDFVEAKVAAVKEVVQRQAHERIFCVIGTEGASADARIEHPANLAEEPRRLGPGDVVEIAHHDGRQMGVANALGGNDQLGDTVLPPG